MSTIYENIQRECRKQGRYMTWVSAQAGLAHSTMQNWRYAAPTIWNLKAVADVLNVKVDDLLEDCDGESSEN